MRNFISAFFILLALSIGLFYNSSMAATPNIQNTDETLWKFQSIDTMKYSRDLAREKENDESYDAEIEKQVKLIKDTGATHIAIGTPYDDEFIPYMKRWVNAARANGLHVWFRGNLSGWEGWFDYEKIDRKTHTEKIRSFILNNPDLFQDGDIFTSCPECENGGPGDPRFIGDVEEYRSFLIGEYGITKKAFEEIHKNVKANYYSMNGDVAKLVMDKETTTALDGIVTIDHYVSSVDKFINDINEYAQMSGGKVVLGEWGAPIPDIHGDMTQAEQAEWIDKAMEKILYQTDIEGMNYWTHEGSSTALWSNEDEPRKAVGIISKYYNPRRVSGEIKDTKGNIIENVELKTTKNTQTITHGTYTVPLLYAEQLTFKKDGYKDVIIQQKLTGTGNITQDIVMLKSNHSFWDKIMDYFFIIFKRSPLSCATMNA